MTQEAQRIWKRSLDEIKGSLSPKTFDAWFSHTRAISLAEGVLAIEVPNEFFKDWLLGHYKDLIAEAIKKSAGCGIQFAFSVGEKGSESLPGGKAGLPPAPRVAQGPSGVLVERFTQHSEFSLNPKYTFESFVLGPSNRFAYAAARAVAESPAKAYNPLFIYGGVGLGKTHLMQAIGHHMFSNHPRHKIVYISSEKFTNQLINAIQNRATARFREKYRSVDTLLIDDIHFIAGKESTQEEFFHTFNALHDAHKQIVISSDRSPKEIPGLENRLVSRFEWGLVTDVQPPDLETRIAILRKKAQEQSITIPDEVTNYIGEKIRSNIRELEGALVRVVAYSALVGEPIGFDLAKNVLKDVVKEAEKVITIDVIQKKVAEHFDVRLSDMKARRRTRAVAYPRQVAMYLARDLTDFSLPEVGEQFGGRDHTTVLHAYEKIKKDVASNASLKGMVDRIVAEIKGGY